MIQVKKILRRRFIQSAIFGTGILLVGANKLFAREDQEENTLQNIASLGYAARDASGHLSPWSFERRALGDHVYH